METVPPLEHFPRSIDEALRYVPGEELPRRRRIDRDTAVVIAGRGEVALGWVEFDRRRVVVWLPGDRCIVQDGGLPRCAELEEAINRHLPVGYELEALPTYAGREWLIHLPNGGEILVTAAEQAYAIFRIDETS